MELGTTQTISEVRGSDIRSRVAAGVGGLAGTGSGGGPLGNNGGDWLDPSLLEPQDPSVGDKSKYIAWFLMMAVGMTFAGLVGAYLMISTNRDVEWKPFDLPFQIWISTAIILASSVTYSLAKRGVDQGSFLDARKWLVVTTVLGALFISSQLVLWLELVNRGYYLSGNPYGGFFYILTAAHAVHVAGGVVALGSIVLNSWYPARNDAELTRRRQLARSVGWYWHFMGALWVVLFLMLGFWK